MINLNEDKYNIKKPLHQESILSFINDYNIFKFYIEYSGVDFEVNTSINSPLRVDKRPSFGVFYSNRFKKYMFHDFKEGYSGDAFVFVQRLFPDLNYQEVLSKICVDFALGDKIDHLEVEKTDFKEFKYVQNPDIRPNLKSLGVKTREFKYHDRQYWSDYGITERVLKKFLVYPISHIFLNYQNDYESIIRCDPHSYVYVENKDNKKTLKIYQPYNRSGLKFLTNHDSTVHDGYTQLNDTGDLLIITKSRKDVMSLYSTANLQSVGVQSEHIIIKESVIEEYKRRFKKIITLFDNDDVGITLSETYMYKYNIPGITIPKTNKYITDYSDLVKHKGNKEARNVLMELIIPYYENSTANNIIHS